MRSGTSASRTARSWCSRRRRSQDARSWTSSGLLVAPGFIDLHEHGQNATSHALHVRDGVTTALDLEAGAWPVAPFYAEREGKSRVNFGVSVGHIAARVKLMHGFAIGHRPTSAGRETGWAASSGG